MFGKKDKKETEPTKAEKTPIDDAKIESSAKLKEFDFVVTEYKERYGGLFSAEDLKEIDQDATSLNILFGIYSELRLLREQMTQNNK